MALISLIHGGTAHGSMGGATVQGTEAGLVMRRKSYTKPIPQRFTQTFDGPSIWDATMMKRNFAYVMNAWGSQASTDQQAAWNQYAITANLNSGINKIGAPTGFQMFSRVNALRMLVGSGFTLALDAPLAQGSIDNGSASAFVQYVSTSGILLTLGPSTMDWNDDDIIIIYMTPTNTRRRQPVAKNWKVVAANTVGFYGGPMPNLDIQWDDPWNINNANVGSTNWFAQWVRIAGSQISQMAQLQGT